MDVWQDIFVVCFVKVGVARFTSAAGSRFALSSRWRGLSAPTWPKLITFCFSQWNLGHAGTTTNLSPSCTSWGNLTESFSVLLWLMLGLPHEQPTTVKTFPGNTRKSNCGLTQKIQIYTLMQSWASTKKTTISDISWHIFAGANTLKQIASKIILICVAWPLFSALVYELKNLMLFPRLELKFS